MLKKIGVAIIGYGMSGRMFHLPPLIEHPRYEVVSVLTNNATNAALLREPYPMIKIIATIEEALEDERVALVVVATPNEQHADYSRRALMAGKHVVVEKPFTETLAEAQALFALAKTENRVLRIYHNRQYDGDILTVHDVIESGKLGEILSFSTRFDTYNPIVKDGWRDKPGVMAGVYYDLAPHLIDHAIRLFGLPRTVYGKSFIDRIGAHVDDHFELALYYDRLVCYLGAQKLDRHPLPRFQVVGTKATYVKYGFDQPDLVHCRGIQEYHATSERSRIIYADGRKDEAVPVRMGAHYRFYDRLAEDIVTPPQDDREAALALAVVGIMERAKWSMERGADIALPAAF